MNEVKTVPQAAMQSDPVIELYKRDIDRTLIRENLKLSIEERILNLQNFMESMEELQAAGKKIAPHSANTSVR